MKQRGPPSGRFLDDFRTVYILRSTDRERRSAPGSSGTDAMFVVEFVAADKMRQDAGQTT
jgi:hypothetical protein